MIYDYPPIPPGSDPSQQLFSSPGLIYRPLCNRLDLEIILGFSKYNAAIFNFTYYYEN